MISNTECYLQDQFIRTKLKAIRKSKGLTQKRLSELSGLSVSGISNIESGENSYTLRSLIKYAEAVGYEINVDRKAGENNGNSEETDKGVSVTDVT